MYIGFVISLSGENFLFVRLSTSVLAILLLPLAVSAQPSALAKFRDWTVFTDNNAAGKICYAATVASDKAPRSASHGDVWFYVSSWGSGVATNQPSLRVGYDLRDDIPGKAIIGRKSWPLYGVDEEAYATDEDDPAFVAAIKAGRELRIEATSSRNTRVAYHFSLSGSTAAIELAQSECR